ncbi:MAG: hypothetical protein RLO18_12135, partial [Gimesia chilikensis]
MRNSTYSARFCLGLILTSICFVMTQSVFAADQKPAQPHVVFVVGTTHYAPQKTLPAFAKRLEQYGFKTTVVLPDGDPERNQKGLPGLEVLEEADLAVFFMRFLQLPPRQFAHIQNYIKSG